MYHKQFTRKIKFYKQSDVYELNKAYRLKYVTFRHSIRYTITLKGPKREIFVAGIFTEIRPVRVGDLETRPKNLKSLCLGPYMTIYFLGFLF